MVPFRKPTVYHGSTMVLNYGLTLAGKSIVNHGWQKHCQPWLNCGAISLLIMVV